MKATIRKRAFSLLLVLTLILGLLPVSALAAEGDPDTGTPVVCAGYDTDNTCAAASHVEGCPLYETPKEPAEEVEEPIPADSAVTALQERIDALPDADTLEEMDKETQTEVYEEICAISDAIDGLTEEQAADLDTAKLEKAAAFFNRQTMMLTTPDDGGDEQFPAGTLSIANGSILITSTGYSQGTLKYDSSSKKWSVTDSNGNAVTETTWSEDEDETNALTITGSADSSTEPYVFVQSGTVSITLQSVTASISAPSTNMNIPVIAIYQGAQAAITLDGESTLTPGTKAAGVQVAGNNGSLTISGNGTLNSTIGSATNFTYANSSNYHRGGGKLTVESGTINGNILDKNGGLEVEINGGTVNGSITNSKADTGKEGDKTTSVTLNTKVTAGVVTGKITCQNGNVTISGGTVEGAITCSKGTVSITGGNINTGYTADISGRTLTQLYFADGSGDALANTEVTITEDGTSWTAQTNSEGMITTYLASSTTSVTAKVGDATSGSSVDIEDGKGLSGISCVCGGENPGTLAMSTTSKGLTVTNDSAALKLEAAYTPSTECKVPSGFHGDYETISYEITKVVKGGSYVNSAQYASIEGDTLTVYKDVNADRYTVYVRAICGPEGNKLSSDEIAISVSTYVSSVDEEKNTLDIAFGSITVSAGTGENSSKTVYTQGEKTISVDADTTVTITGTYEYSADNADEHYIRIEGGSPTIELKDLTIIHNAGSVGSNDVKHRPAIVLMSGTDSANNTATLILSGTNTLSGANQAPAVQINKNATLTIQGDGTLNATGTNNVSAIGAPRNNAYAINPTTKKADNNYRSGGSLIIEGGTINATGAQAGASIGASHSTTFGDITIKGGVVNALRTSVGSGISTKTNASSGGGSVTIEGGVVNAASQSGSNQKYDAIHAEGGFSMTGGTLSSLTLTGSTDGVNYISVGTGENAGVSITGGNINGYYTGTEKDSRVLTKLYFVTEDGSPVANTKVTVTEGTGDNAKIWTALTNDKGVITTYFASGTDSISVSYGNQSKVNAEIKAHQALIGGTCTCSDFAGITWDSGLPGTVTLFGEGDSTYSVAEAALVVEGDCPMPIHPNLTAITYSLSVTANGSTVDESSTGTYAALEDGTLTLKPANAPYTVTLTAKAGEKTAAQTIQVLKGASDEGVTTIDLSKGNVVISYNSDSSTYSYTQGSSEDSTTATGSILLTGDAASATVTVNGGSPTLTVNQNSPDNVWAIYTDASVTGLALDAQTVNGKVRFGAADSKLAAMSYISAEKVKLNPETGATISLTDSGITQGIFSLSGVSGKALSVYGANGDSATTLTNSTSDAATLTVNGASVELAAGGSYTIPKAVIIDPNSADNSSVYAYVIPNDRTLYCYNAFELGLSEDVNRNYAVEDIAEYVEMWRFEESASERLTQTTAQAYTILFVGEGATAASTYKDYPYKDVEGHSNAELYRGQITDVTFDPDIDTLAGNILRGMLGVVEIRVENATTVSGAFYSCGVRELYLGEQVTSYSSSNYMGVLKEIEVAEGNTALMSHDGVLYTADGKTLLQCPARKAGSYTLLDTCEAISNVAFYSSRLSALTLDANLKSIGTRAFESMWNLTAIHVKTGNASFKAVDGVLYSADGATLILYPINKPDAEFEIPEGVTKLADMAFYQYRAIKKVTLPSTLASVDNYFMDGVPLEEMVINGPVYTNVSRFDTQVLRTVTVMDGYDFTQSNLFAATSMKWVGSAVTVSGVSSNENIPYDGAAHGITVTTTAENATVEYSEDGVAYSETAPTYTAPGTYTVYWRITKAANDEYEFARELYSSRTFTISALKASEDWFTLTTVKTEGVENPVTLSQPAAAPSLENGYTVKYSKDGTGEATETAPTEAGKYLVTVDITADGYAKETLTLGYYIILSDDQSGSVVLSFVTYGGTAIEPLIWSNSETNSKTAPDDPTRNGYTFAGWYTDTSLRTKATLGENNSISKPSTSTTWYAQWTRDTYTITYDDLHGAKNDNPTTYTVESPTFTLNAPVLAGYLFKGWKTSDQIVPSSSVTIEHGSYGDKTYTAVWELIQYTIAYTNVEGVENNPTSYTVTDTASKGISLTAPAAREGYTFSGWQMTVDGVAYVLPAENAEIPQGTVGNIVLSGIWLAEGQTLTLNANGGAFTDGQETMTISADYASSITLTQPTRTGYSFAGWYADSNLETPFDASTMPLSTTIYAKWTSSLSIKPSATSITGSDTVTLTVENAVGTVSVTCDQTITVSGSGNTWTATLPNKDATYTFTVSAENGTASCTVTVTYKSSGGGGGSSSGSSTYTVTVDSGKNGTVSVSPKSASKGTTVTITVKPDSGYELDDLTVTDKNGNEVKLTKKSDTQYTFTMPASKVTVEASFAKIEEQPEIAFVDVSTSAYYYDAVAWAVENGVTSGTSATTFSPDAACTRAQAVTFLWRAAGSPAPKSSVSPFTDVPATAYYYNAVLWAVEQGITVGTSATTFSPDATCTRGQIVTFLFRAVGTTTNENDPFVDVADGAYYADAVKWAVAESVTAGTSATTFSPDASCTRAQIVTFLYRAYA